MRSDNCVPPHNCQGCAYGNVPIHWVQLDSGKRATEELEELCVLRAIHTPERRRRQVSDVS